MASPRRFEVVGQKILVARPTMDMKCFFQRNQLVERNKTMSYTPLQWPTPRLTPRITKFDEKFMELHNLKLDIHRKMRKFNALKARYVEWFEHRHRTFLQTVNLMQILGGGTVPGEINTIRHFRRLYGYCNKRKRRGITPRDACNEMVLVEFLNFWDDFVKLKPDVDVVYEKICDYCNSVKTLREPEIKLHLDNLYSKLTLVYSEDFDFTSIHNEKHNLFTYGISMAEHKYHGLLSYLPYLSDFATRICYWSQRIYLEKE